MTQTTTAGKISDALEVVDGWDEVVREIIRCTPEDRLFDWKLVCKLNVSLFTSFLMSEIHH